MFFVYRKLFRLGRSAYTTWLYFSDNTFQPHVQFTETHPMLPGALVSLMTIAFHHQCLFNVCPKQRGKITSCCERLCMQKCEQVSIECGGKLADVYLEGAFSHSLRLKILFFSEFLCPSVTTDAFQDSFDTCVRQVSYNNLVTLTCLAT